MPVGSDAKWSGSASGASEVFWATVYSGSTHSAECTVGIQPDDTASKVAKALKTAFNAANSPEYTANLSGPNLEIVHFSPPENVVGMTANGDPVTSQGISIDGLTVQNAFPA